MLREELQPFITENSLFTISLFFFFFEIIVYVTVAPVFLAAGSALFVKDALTVSVRLLLSSVVDILYPAFVLLYKGYSFFFY
jgi:hypothetical protein